MRHLKEGGRLFEDLPYRIFLITTKQSNNKSYFSKKTQQCNAVPVLGNFMILNKTYREQDLYYRYLKLQNSSSLHFFRIILNCIIFHLSKETLIDFEIKILLFHFSNKQLEITFFIFQVRVSNSEVKKLKFTCRVSNSK